MRRARRREQEESEVNLTPMLDVVFIMLIFFIVTASFVKEAGIDVSRPPAATAERKERGNILVAITENDQIWIDRRQVDPRALRANIERLHAENPQGSVVIQADKKSKNGLLVQVMDAARLAGVKQRVARRRGGGLNRAASAAPDRTTDRGRIAGVRPTATPAGDGGRQNGGPREDQLRAQPARHPLLPRPPPGASARARALATRTPSSGSRRSWSRKPSPRSRRNSCAMRLVKLEQLIEMLRDDEWRLEGRDRARILDALAYFVDPDDLIPDRVPGIGYLDDAIMVELVVQELKHDIKAYEDFCEFRESHPKAEGGAKLEARRLALQARMRRRRRRERQRHRDRPGSTRSPIRLW